MEDEFEKDDAYRQATDNEASLAFYSDFINFLNSENSVIGRRLLKSRYKIQWSTNDTIIV